MLFACAASDGCNWLVLSWVLGIGVSRRLTCIMLSLGGGRGQFLPQRRSLLCTEFPPLYISVAGASYHVQPNRLSP